MKIEKRDGSIERRIVIGLVTDPTVLARISAKWEGHGLFASKWANLVGGWAIHYYNKYHKAPMKHIRQLFEQWAEKSHDDETTTLVEKFLSSISDEYEALAEETNSHYLIDLAGKLFNQVKLNKLAEAVQDEVAGGDAEKALQKVLTFGKVELGEGEGIHVLGDMDAVREAFTEEETPLIAYPGAIGKFFGNAFQRDALIGFMGPEKRGKTWWLMDVAYRGLLQHRKVAFFEVGDLSQNQIMRRLMIRISRHPRRRGRVYFPTRIEKDEETGSATVEQSVKDFEKGLSWRRAWKSCQKLIKRRIKSQIPLLRLSIHPNSTLSVKGIEGILRSWEREEWVPDIIVIDYADILADIGGAHNMEKRDQVNETWKGLRRLSQSLHCLVVTATQTNASSYKADLITKSNFSEDKRKLAHVTGMIGLNATTEEKENQVTRLNWVVLREEEFSESRCVHAAGCLALGNPAIISCF